MGFLPVVQAVEGEVVGQVPDGCLGCGDGFPGGAPCDRQKGNGADRIQTIAVSPGSGLRRRA